MSLPYSSPQRQVYTISKWFPVIHVQPVGTATLLNYTHSSPIAWDLCAEKKWHGRASSASVLLARQAHFLHPDLCRFPLEITWNDHEQSDVHRLLGSMRPIFIIWLVVSTCFTPSEKYESQVPASLRATPNASLQATSRNHTLLTLWTLTLGNTENITLGNTENITLLI